MRDAALVGGQTRWHDVQGGWEVQAGPSGTATPACGARARAARGAIWRYLALSG